MLVVQQTRALGELRLELAQLLLAPNQLLAMGFATAVAPRGWRRQPVVGSRNRLHDGWSDRRPSVNGRPRAAGHTRIHSRSPNYPYGYQRCGNDDVHGRSSPRARTYPSPSTSSLIRSDRAAGSPSCGSMSGIKDHVISREFRFHRPSRPFVRYQRCYRAPTAPVSGITQLVRRAHSLTASAAVSLS